MWSEAVPRPLTVPTGAVESPAAPVAADREAKRCLSWMSPPVAASSSRSAHIGGLAGRVTAAAGPPFDHRGSGRLGPRHLQRTSGVTGSGRRPRVRGRPLLRPGGRSRPAGSVRSAVRSAFDTGQAGAPGRTRTCDPPLRRRLRGGRRSLFMSSLSSRPALSRQSVMQGRTQTATTTATTTVTTQPPRRETDRPLLAGRRAGGWRSFGSNQWCDSPAAVSPATGMGPP